MLNSLFKKMLLLSSTALGLTFFIVVSFTKISDEQKRTQSELEQIVELQLSVDMLRSQLWVFLQFSDNPSLKEVEYAQADLATKLLAYGMNNGLFDNIQNMNQSLLFLLTQEKKVYEQKAVNEGVTSGSSQALGLLHSRYNMIVQNMTEELVYIQQVVLHRNASTLDTVMYTTAGWLIFCSIVVSVTAWLVLIRFRIAIEAMKEAIIRLSQGDLESKVENVKMDAEFRLMALFFNRMTRRLCRTTVTKKELEAEVNLQTKQIQQHHEKLLYLSEHDPLTNLINRRAFDKQLESSIVKAQRSGCKLAVLFIDLDAFKYINDTYGHDVGDAVLVEVANRLSDSIRASDFVGRLGGDEFVVCLDLLNDYSILSSKVEQIRSSINEPIVFGERLVSVGASIGVSCYPEHSKNRERLMRLADKAMYEDKEANSETIPKRLESVK